jgi:hypothetical protein
VAKLRVSPNICNTGRDDGARRGGETAGAPGRPETYSLAPPPTSLFANQTADALQTYTVRPRHAEAFDYNGHFLSRFRHLVNILSLQNRFRIRSRREMKAKLFNPTFVLTHSEYHPLQVISAICCFIYKVTVRIHFHCRTPT